LLRPVVGSCDAQLSCVVRCASASVPSAVVRWFYLVAHLGSSSWLAGPLSWLVCRGFTKIVMSELHLRLIGCALERAPTMARPASARSVDAVGIRLWSKHLKEARVRVMFRRFTYIVRRGGGHVLVFGRLLKPGCSAVFTPLSAVRSQHSIGPRHRISIVRRAPGEPGLLRRIG